MAEFTLEVSGRRVVNGVLEPESPPVQLYMQREDKEVFGSIRSCAPCPAVFVLKDDPHAFMNQQWQYYLRAINYNMTVDNVYLLLDRALAFANRTGFRNPNSPKADWFHNKDLSYRPPNLDKVRTTSRSVMTGTEEFNIPTFVYNTQTLMQQIVARTISFMGAKSLFASLLARKENVLRVKVFDSRDLPPLKPGYKYPGDISEVNPNAYAIMPETHPEMFLVANIVNARGEVVQFPRGALYPWFEGGRTPASFVPHIANLAYGPILYPLRYLSKVPLGSPKPSPYRHGR
jgi:hypothetical protein